MRKASISATGLFRQEKALMRYHSVKRDYLPDLLFLINRILTLIIGPERILMLYTKVFSNSGIYNDNTKLYENGLAWNMSMYILWVAILTVMLRIMFCGVLMLISNILCSGNHNILSQLWMKKCLCLSSINSGFHKLQQFCFIHSGYLSLFFQNKPMNAEISITQSASAQFWDKVLSLRWKS